MRFHRLCWHHWIIAKRSTRSIIPYSLTALADSTLISLGGVNSSALEVPGLPSLNALLVIHKGQSWLHTFRLYIYIYIYIYIYSPYHTSSAFWPFTAAVRWWFSARSRHFQRDYAASFAKLELYLTALHIGSARMVHHLTQTNPKQ